MAVFVLGTIKPKNGKSPVAEAQDILMPDGKRLDEFTPVFPTLHAVTGQKLEPEVFYNFGAVESLAVELIQKNDGLAHEYWFQFEPQEGFVGLTISPEVKWVNDLQYPVGKTCLVGICMGMAVMAVV